jgi:hypothetical protein
VEEKDVEVGAEEKEVAEVEADVEPEADAADVKY